MPVMTAKQLVKILETMGFVLIRQKGSHAALRHSDGRMAIIPMHSGDLPLGTLRGILSDIGIVPSDLK